jgi:hypothetical protein|tara:strand:- start:474 stop:1256 length:783 start_codon:yes stop_codon:yes gene_type:complete
MAHNGKYFTVEVKPTIPASKQHIGAFAIGDLLFDWTKFEIPRGGAKLISACVLTRPLGNTTPTPNDNRVTFVLASNNDLALGTVNSEVQGSDHRPSNDFVGFFTIDEADTASVKLNSTSIQMARDGASVNDAFAFKPFVITPNMNASGVTDGFSEFYIAGITQDTSMQFGQTAIRINDGDIDTASPGTTLATDGSSMDIREHFLPGDVLHAHDDAVIGTVASVTDANDLELTTAISTGVLEDDDYVYNIHPMRIILGFEI